MIFDYMFTEVIFDLETKKFFDEVSRKDPALLGVSVVSLYRRRLGDDQRENEGEMLSFWENDFDRMWEVFRSADRIIGFNSLGFDVPALIPYAPSDFARLPHFDILTEIKKLTEHRTSLDAIAKETLGKHKIDSGANAIAYWSRGDKKSLAKLKKYCEADVAITRAIYDFAVKNGFLLFKDHWNNPRKVQLDFSYKQEDQKVEGQPSLF